MSTPSASPRQTATALTRIALRLLDVTFEPASPCSGERFDRVVEALSDHLSTSGSALLAGRPLPPFAPPALPLLSATATRRAQAALRDAVDAGRIPGSTRSVNCCLMDLRSCCIELTALLEQQPDLQASSLSETSRALERLVRVISVYEHSHRRISAALALPGCSREEAGDSATRAERALLRCLPRVSDDRMLR